MPQQENLLFTVEGAKIIWPNFTGKPTKFKPEGGVRTFNLELDHDQAEQMANDGWNVKCKLPDEEDAVERCILEVTVGYKIKPPKVVAITDSSRTLLTEESIGTLDWADIRNIDMTIAGSFYDVNGKTGYKAYLRSMFVTIEEDELDRKYAHLEMGAE